MMRFAAPALTALTLAAPVQALDLSAMSDDERAAFRAEVRAYLMENPEVIFEAVAVIEERQDDALTQADVTRVETNRDAIFDDGFSWVGGNPDGDITLVEFMDYRCGYCRKAVPEVAKLLEEDGNIRLIVKEFPILGEASVISSRFAIAAKHVAGEDAYEQVHNALMEFTGDPDDVALTRLAEGLGLDAKAIMALMDSETVDAEIAKTLELAQKLQISGTPTFVLQDQMLRGYLPADQMAEMVAEIRAKE